MNKNSSEKSMHYELYVTKKQTKFNDWLYSKMKPYLKGDILETGSGVGIFSEKIIKDFPGNIYLTEIDPFFLKKLRKKFKEKNVKVAKLDLNKKEDFSKIKTKFDSIFSSNVLEHVPNDVLALKMLKNMLKPKGLLVILVPCHKFLFCGLDKEEGHYRRYSKKEIEEKAKKAGFRIKYSFWFNMFAIPGRFINGNLFKSKKTHAGSFDLFNKLIPFLRFFEEKVFRSLIGVSRIVVLQK